MTIRAGLTDSTRQRIAGEPCNMTIRAIASSLPSACHVNQMKLLLGIELRGRTGEPTAFPFNLGDIAPNPSPIFDRISECPSVRRIQRLARERRDIPAAVLMTACAGEIATKTRSERPALMFGMAGGTG